jgi:exonuclease VII small subunit
VDTTSGLKNISNALDDTGFPELAHYKQSVNELEAAGKLMESDPSKENIEAFVDKAKDVEGAIVDGLKGKIDEKLYNDVSAEVTGFVSSVENAADQYNAGNLDETNTQMEGAIDKGGSLTETVANTMTLEESKEILQQAMVEFISQQQSIMDTVEQRITEMMSEMSSYSDQDVENHEEA